MKYLPQEPELVISVAGRICEVLSLFFTTFGAIGIDLRYETRFKEKYVTLIKYTSNHDIKYFNISISDILFLKNKK